MIGLIMRHSIPMILFKWQRVVMGIFLTIFVVGLCYLTFAERKYESAAELIVKFGNRPMPDFDRSPTTELTPADRHEIVLSHAAILSSPDLAQATIKAVGVDKMYPRIVDDPPSRWSVMDEAVRRFKDDLWVGVGAQDNVITVSFLNPDKALAQKVVENLINQYVGQQTTVYHDPHSDFLKNEVTQAAARLNTAQISLNEFKTQWQISDFDQEIDDLLQQRGDVDSSLQTAQAALNQAQHRQVDLEKLMRDVPRTMPESAGGEKYRSMDDAQSRLADLRNKKSQMLATYSANSPALIQLNAGIVAAEADLRERQNDLGNRSAANPNSVYQTLQTDYLRTVADAESNAQPVEVLTKQLAGIDKRLDDLRKARGDFDNRVREHDLAEDLYKSLSTQYEDARVKDGINQSRISSVAVISQPTLPYRTARPRYLITFVAVVLGGALLAVWGALICEAMDDRFTTAEQLALFLDLPVFTSIDERRPVFPSLPASQGA